MKENRRSCNEALTLGITYFIRDKIPSQGEDQTTTRRLLYLAVHTTGGKQKCRSLHATCCTALLVHDTTHLPAFCNHTKNVTIKLLQLAIESMEVDDGLVADSVFTNFGKTSHKAVHFDERIDIPVDVEVNNLLEEDAVETTVKPKHKARRRSRNSSSSKEDDEQVPVQRIVAPSKLRKLSDKDRHVSRTGKGRGKPKKGMNI